MLQVRVLSLRPILIKVDLKRINLNFSCFFTLCPAMDICSRQRTNLPSTNTENITCYEFNNRFTFTAICVTILSYGLVLYLYYIGSANYEG